MADAKLPFLRRLTLKGKPKSEEEKMEESWSVRRTRSLCEGRAGFTAGRFIQMFPGFGRPNRMMDSLRRGSTLSHNNSMSSMDLKTSPTAVLSTIVPLPVEIEQLCESAFSKLYCPYDKVRWTLLDQIRRIYYGDCHADIQTLCHTFLAPAANLLDLIKRQSQESEGSFIRRRKHNDPVNAGWPLCYDNKVIIHLTEIDRHRLPSGKLQRGHFYFHISSPSKSPESSPLFLCLKLRILSGEVLEVRIPANAAHLKMAFSSKWFHETIFHCTSDMRLLSALQFCVVSFERSIDRIDLQLLTSGLRTPANGNEAALLDRHSTALPDNEPSSFSLAHDECQCQCSPNAIMDSSRSSSTTPFSQDHGPFHQPVETEHMRCSCLPSSATSTLNLSQSQNLCDMDPKKSADVSSPSSCWLARGAHLINEINKALLSSEAVVFPGTIDRQRHPVVFLNVQRFPEMVTADELARLFSYIYFTAREPAAHAGFTLVVDTPIYEENSTFSEKLEKFFVLLDTAIWKFQDVIQNWVFRVLVLLPSDTPIDVADKIRDAFAKTSTEKITFVHGKADLPVHIDDMNILSTLDGRLSFNHQKFVAYRCEIEPFMETCRLASRRLLEAIHQMKLQDKCLCQCNKPTNSPADRNVNNNVNQDRHVFSAAHYHLMIRAQKVMMQSIAEDPHLLQLQSEGETLLLKFQQEQSSRETRDAYDQAAQLYNDVHTTTIKLMRLADRRLSKLEKCYQLKRFEEDAGRLLMWMSKEGESTLQWNLQVGNSLVEVREQQKEFDKFQATASKNLDKACHLLTTFSSLNLTSDSECPAVIIQLYRLLASTHRRFSDFLDEVRDRIDDVARCYCLIERAFEWTLHTVNFMSQFSLSPETTSSLPLLNESLTKLDSYVRAHPPLTPDNFHEMDQIAHKLKLTKLIDQCKLARQRCQEAESLTIAKETAFLKAKFALVPALPAQELVTRLPRNRTPICTPFRESSFRTQYSIPETDETLSSSDTTPFIDDSDNDAVVPLGSCACSSSSATLADVSSPMEARNTNGGLRKSSTWQAGDMDGTPSRNGCEESYTDEDFDEVDNARLNRRESWTVPSSNSHLSFSLDKESFTPLSPSQANDGTPGSLIVQELFQTEIDYIIALKFVIENYMPEILKDSVPQSLRGKRNVVFGNLTKLYDFHRKEFLKAIKQCECSPIQLGQVFLKFEKYFHMYAQYTHNKPKSDKLMSECGNEFFKARQNILQDRMDLSSYLLRPVQRMGKYALLLKQLLKVYPRSDPEWEKLQEAEEMVKFQLRHGNDLLAMDQLRDCDVDLKEQGRLCRQDDLLAYQAGRKKCLRRVFLFDDMILFSKVKRSKQGTEYFQYKHSLKTSDIGLTEQLGESPNQFEIWFRKRKSGDNFILQAANIDVKQAWTRDISSILWRQAWRSRETRLSEMDSMGIEKRNCLDIKPSEDQINHRYVLLRAGSGPSSFDLRGSTHESLRGRLQRPHSLISISNSCSNSAFISSPILQEEKTEEATKADGATGDEDRSSPRRSQCSSESGICSDINTSSTSNPLRESGPST